MRMLVALLVPAADKLGRSADWSSHPAPVPKERKSRLEHARIAEAFQRTACVFGKKTYTCAGAKDTAVK